MSKWKSSERTYYRAGFRDAKLVGDQIEITMYGNRTTNRGTTYHETYTFRMDWYNLFPMARKLHECLNTMQDRVNRLRRAMRGES